jgi:hypothetical protein
MNPHPIEFSPSEELGRFGDVGHELYGLSERVFFYLVSTCHSVMAFSEPSFTIEPVYGPPGPPGTTPSGCWVEFVVRQAFWIDASPTRVRLWTSSGDEVDAHSRYLVFEGDCANPTAWEGVIKAIGRVEHFAVCIPLADKLRHLWTQLLAERQRRDDERGW